MNELFSSGRFVDIALLAIGVEVIVLLLLARARGGGALTFAGARALSLTDIGGQLLAGALLLVALRCVVTGADPRWTLALLTASFPAHLFDLVRRVRFAASHER